MKKIVGIILGVIVLGCMGCKKDEVAESEDYTEIDKAIILEYLDSNNITATETSSGLFYEIIDPGYGVRPNVNSYVSVKYRGYYTSGVVFDQATSAVSFGLGNLIAGWKEGIPLIKKGGEIKLFVPSHLAYGSTGSGSVPPNTVLIFEIELIDVN